ncbi:hypothetical protein AMJ57_04675 [Parcubacteria bacterium SG8_24]|nr:MAG: hypothetical protein AMJ57_04675 [Parcubacteria bacterium SG8_24]
MRVFVFGNPEIAIDSLPLRLLPRLRRLFPQTDFVDVDPNEDWDIPEEMTVIDTVIGLGAPNVFDDLRNFERSPAVTMHDFDALAYLRLLIKLGKLQRVTVIGLPPDIDEDKAIVAITEALRQRSFT